MLVKQIKNSFIGFTALPWYQVLAGQEMEERSSVVTHQEMTWDTSRALDISLLYLLRFTAGL